MSATQPSWSSIFQRIVSNVQEIVRSEIHLAKVELKEEAQEAVRASVSLTIGGVLGVYSAVFILLAIVHALDLVLAAWLSALIVGIMLGLGAFLCIEAGRKKLKRVKPKPIETIESVKETLEWVKN